MKLGDKAKAVVAFGIAVAVIIVVGIVANAVLGKDDLVAKETKMEKVLGAAEHNDLTMTGATLADVYGTEYAGGITVCGGTSKADVEQMGVPAEKLHLTGDTVPRDYNYIAMAKQDGTVDVDRFSVDELNLCPQGQPSPIAPQALMGFVKNPETNGWVLAGVVQ